MEMFPNWRDGRVEHPAGPDRFPVRHHAVEGEECVGVVESRGEDEAVGHRSITYDRISILKHLASEVNQTGEN